MALHDLPPGLRRLPPYVSSAAGEGAAEPGDALVPAAPEFVHTLVVAGTTTKQALPANRRRSYLLVQNRGSNDVYLVFGGKAAVNTGVLIAASGGVYEPFTAPGSSVSIITSSGSSNVVLVEGIG